jgi:hypothetical protein
MLDLIFNTLSDFAGFNLRDPHEMPFAMPLMVACFLGGTIGFTLVKMLVNEQKARAR